MKLEIQNITKTYSRADRQFNAAEGVSFTAVSHDFISITGRSGSGKSTILSIISGIAAPSSGSVIINGENLTALSPAEKNRFRNKNIGYIPQGETLLANLTVFDNVRLPWFLTPRSGSPDKRASELLERLGIEQLRDSLPAALSGGEIRRAAIARALINDPDLIVADEPTSNLDSENTVAIMNILADIAREGKIIITATHELDTLSYGNKQYIMDNGKLSLL